MDSLRFNSMQLRNSIIRRYMKARGVVKAQTSGELEHNFDCHKQYCSARSLSIQML